MAESINGAAYRVKAKHPRRDMPLRVTTKDGAVIAEAGQSCAGLSQELLSSMLANGFVEPVIVADAGDLQALPVRRIKGKV